MHFDARSVHSLPNDDRWSTLCPELMYEIFTYCLSGNPLHTCFPSLFPWYLGHICRSWRSVFISSPHFWDRFTFEASVTEAFETNDYLDSPHPIDGYLESFHAIDSRLKRALTIVELCLKRTKDQPFSFRFSAQSYDDVATSYMYRAMKSIAAHADRWSVAYVEVKGFGGVEQLLLKAKHRFGQLHTLQISIPLGTSYHLDLFEDTPNLTRVYTTDYYRLRWSNLTVLHIEISSRTPVRLFTVFDKMTCLKELIIQGLPLQQGALPVLETPVEIPSLKILYVNHYYPLPLIRAPSLEILHLGDILPVLRPTAVEMFLRGASHLRTLSFNIDICNVLDYIHELDHAIVIGRHLALAVLVCQRMAHSLKTITISDPDIFERKRGTKVTLCDITAIIQHMEKHQFPNLRRLSVHVYDDGEEDMSPAIDDLVRLGPYKGFEIDIKFSPPQIMPPFRDL